MQAFLKKNFWVVNVATVVICSVFAATAANHVIEAKFLGDDATPAKAAPPPPPSRAEPEKRRSKSGEALAKRNMFCSTCEPPEPEQVAEGPIVDSDTPPITSLPLKLIATNVSDREDRSFATITNTGKSRVGAYRVGEDIPEAGKVVRIAGKFVDFENQSSRRVERIAFNEQARPKPSTPARRTPTRTARRDDGNDELDQGINKTSDTSYEIERSLVEKIMANPAMIRGARIVPSIKNGKPNGFKLYAIRPSSAFAKIGLQNGDTIHAINGFDLTTPDKALEVYTKVREASNLSVSVTRRGKPVTMDYTIR